jgi:NTP pyrophosphatase (non-canonical NTP hydrolase)
MTIQDLQHKTDAWINEYGVRYFDVKTNALILTEEVGEFARLVARVYGEQSFKIEPSDEEKKQMLADELTDILWVAVCLANQLDIDLTKGIEKNFVKKTSRDATRHHDNAKLSKI